jgi:hypothetical protein
MTFYCVLFFSCLPHRSRRTVHCCPSMEIVQKLNETLCGIQAAKAWVAHGHKTFRSELPEPDPGQEQPCGTSLCVWGPSCGRALVCLWQLYVPTAHCPGRVRGMAAQCRRNSVCQAAHSGKKLEYLLNNGRVICDRCVPGLGPCLSQSACLKIPPKPRSTAVRELCLHQQDSNKFSYLQMVKRQEKGDEHERQQF